MSRLLILKKEKNVKLLAAAAVIFYLVCLVRNVCVYCGLLKDYFTKPQISDGASYFDLLEGNYAPDIISVISMSVYLLAFLSLAFYTAAVFRNRYRKPASIALCAACIVSGIMSLVSVSLGVLPVLIQLGIAGALFYMGYAGYKKKTAAIAYAVVLILMIAAKTVLPDIFMISVVDIIALILLSILGANWEYHSIGTRK